MTTDRLPPIPPELMERIRQFLVAGRTGRVVLNVHQGEIASADLCDTWRRAERSARLVPPVDRNR